MPATSFTLRLRVYYEDTDAGGIVYYANYLRFMERARTEWLRDLGARHGDLADTHDAVFVVREVHVQYLKPAKLDDELIVDATPIEVRRASLRMLQTVRREGETEPLVSAEVRLAVVERTTGRPVGMPRWLTDRLNPTMRAR